MKGGLAQIPRLRQLLLLLSSDQPGEVAAAAAAIGRALKADCADRCELLRSREAEFIESLGEWRGRPTEKQMAWLHAIYARLRRQTA